MSVFLLNGSFFINQSLFLKLFSCPCQFENPGLNFLNRSFKNINYMINTDEEVLEESDDDDDVDDDEELIS